MLKCLKLSMFVNTDLLTFLLGDFTRELLNTIKVLRRTVQKLQGVIALPLYINVAHCAPPGFAPPGDETATTSKTGGSGASTPPAVAAAVASVAAAAKIEELAQVRGRGGKEKT